VWAARLEQMAREAGVNNVALCTAPVKNGWYDRGELVGLPEKFAMAFNDGPPRHLASRMPLFAQFGKNCRVVIADDADDAEYLKSIEAWARKNRRKVSVVGRAAYLERK
jgi:hypothetical protein